MTSCLDHALIQLADHCGILLNYYDVSGSPIAADPEVILHVLRAMGVELQDRSQAARRLEELKNQERDRLLEPVYVLVPGPNPSIKLRGVENALPEKLEVHVEKESGENVEGLLPLQGQGNLSLPWNLEPGYHRLRVRWGKKKYDAKLICSSGQVWGPPPSRAWGIFAPLYALHSQRSWGMGDFSQLKDLIRWTGELGGEVVGTLPLLSLNLNSTTTPSPYFPWSRLFWNEIFLDVTQIPEFTSSPEAQNLFSSDNFQTQLQEAQSGSLIRYSQVHSLKKSVLLLLLKDFLRHTGPRREAFHRFVQGNPLLESYARSQGRNDGTLETPLAESYHQWVQWLAEIQLEEAAWEAKHRGVRISLDYPLGVSGEGFDCWAFPQLFARGVSVGAPPDPFFSGGQNWGFPPLHPQNIREDGYEYFSRTLRHQLRFGKLLRVDHIMGFHRLFWIPDGVEARKGVYVKYPAEEFYAVLALESQRHQAWVVGEDLGTVPPEVRPAMRQHHLLRSFIAQYENPSDISELSRNIPRDSVAALNTHDMPPFAAFWGKRPNPHQALQQHLTGLAKSQAALAMINLEDLWLETESQNIPGTVDEHPNWRRKFKMAWEEIQNNTELKKILKDFHHSRRNP